MAELVDKIFQFISTIKFHDLGLETEIPNFYVFLGFPWPVRTLCMRIKAMSFRSVFHLYLLKRSVEFASRLPCLNKNDCHVGCGCWRAQDEVCLRLSRATIQKSYTFLPTEHKVSQSSALISKELLFTKMCDIFCLLSMEALNFCENNAEMWSRRMWNPSRVAVICAVKSFLFLEV